MIFTLLIFVCIANSLVFANECGHQVSHPGEFIIGGADAKPGEFPWFVEIKAEDKTAGSGARCGAALIADQWVLTAGHCTLVRNDRPDLYTAYVAVTDLKSADIDKHTAKVLKVFRHEHFNVSYDEEHNLYTVHNDIGLIKLDTNNLPIKNDLVTICLNQTEVSLTSECYIAGMGATQDNNQQAESTKLIKLNDQVADDQKCLTMNKNFDTTSQLCVGGTGQGGKGACHGDSGSGLQCKATDGRFYLLGVASYLTNPEAKCGQPNSPDVYTKVAHYKQWIENIIKEN